MLQPIPESDSISNFDDAMDVDGASQSGRIIKNSLEAWDEYTNSEDYSSGRASPAPSQYTVTDSLLDSCFEDKHGRKVNTTSETYVFAADVEEESVRFQLSLASLGTDANHVDLIYFAIRSNFNIDHVSVSVSSRLFSDSRTGFALIANPTFGYT